MIDPRHPLFGETFRLIQIEDRADKGKCCLVERDWGHNTYLPIEVTDKSEHPLVSSSISLSVKAIRQLVLTYTRLTEDDLDVSTPQITQGTEADSNKNHLVTAKSCSKDPFPTDLSPSLSDSCPKSEGEEDR